ncbi:MAG: conjugal transfer protein TraH, partial [Rhodocyclaceae bacterium]|nr:conjugal transfer protein TraH [Rhodocyclaceae bacterium]
MLLALPAQAGLQEAVRGIYMSTVTNPQAINTLKMNGFYAGQLSLRSIGRTYTVVQFAPPKLSMGCGGIDIFFGAFSFINGQQFEQMIRSIIAAAPSFVLRMAISQMCQQCGEIIDKLQEFANAVNQLGRQTCELAGALLGDPASRESVEKRFSRVQATFK